MDKKFILIAVVIITAAFFMVFNIGYNMGVSVQTDSKDSFMFKNRMIDLQYMALETADSLMEKHNLFDADGSDLMQEYITTVVEIDNLWRSQL